MLISSSVKSVAILGGAFDPIHLGHLAVAEDTLAGLDLDAIWFVPTAQSPLKNKPPGLHEAGRLRLLRTALEDFPDFHLCPAELHRGGISYTIDTVRHLNEQYPDMAFSWIIGADQVMQLDQWVGIGELAERVRFIAVARPGFEMALPRTEIPGLRIEWVAARTLDISSTEIRRRIGEGKAVNHLLPKPVAELIMKRKYYSKF